MNRLITLLICLFISICIFGQEKIKYRKLEYVDFKNEFGINDTAMAVMDIYFEKKESAAYGEMSFLPITAGLTLIPQTRIIGLATSAIALPIFLHGTYTLVKFSKRNLYKKLSDYKTSNQLPKWIQKKVGKQLVLYKEMEREY